MKFLNNATRNTQHATQYLSLIIIVLIGAFLRFYKLDWGSGYFFHPDEYHIAAAVDHLSFPTQMNPELFSYGSFTVYLIYLTQNFFSFLFSHFPLLKSHFPFLTSHFVSAVLIGRFYSALFSTLTIVLVYFISHKLVTGRWSLVAAALCATLPGLVQQAHFATPESVLTFWLFFTLLMLLKFLKTKKNRYLYLAAASQGLALGTKITAITFLPVVLLTSTLAVKPPRIRLISLIGLIGKIFVFLSITVFFFFLSFPYAFLDHQGFINSWNYETGVARGILPVFYTRQFINTTPILFHVRKIFPYALGPGVLILGSLGVLGYLGNLLKKTKNISHITYHISLITLAFLAYFLPNAFLFAKWTRFMTPIFPFFAIFTAYFSKLISRIKLLRIVYCILLVANLVWALMFFSIYLRPDVRITTTDWLNQNLPANSFILTESGNMLEVPLEGNLKKTAFDFYHLEENSQLQDKLPEFLSQTDYFIIQSRRIFANHQRLPEQFPKTANFYNLLFTNQLGFEKIKELDSFPKFSIFNFQFSINDEMAEETWSVFDHPMIRVYKKVKLLTTQDYQKLLSI